jgi:hypothetical protein
MLYLVFVSAACFTSPYQFNVAILDLVMDDDHFETGKCLKA